MRHSIIRVLAAALLFNASASAQLLEPGEVVNASLNADGVIGNGSAYGTWISGNGRFVLFESDAEDLVANDSNGKPDAFLHDLKRGRTRLVSQTAAATSGSDDSQPGGISRSGRFAVMRTYATDLFPGDANGFADIVVFDKRTGEFEPVSVSTDGVAANEDNTMPSISANGRFVAFCSRATNLVPGDMNAKRDAFVRDRKKGTTECVSIGPGGVFANGVSSWPVLSSSGRFVAFWSAATNIETIGTGAVSGVFVRDRKTGFTVRASVTSTGAAAAGVYSECCAISASGRFVVFAAYDSVVPGDSNGHYDVFVRDMKDNVTELVSARGDGVLGNGDALLGRISDSGRFVYFDSRASNLAGGDTNGSEDAFVHDRKTGEVERVGLGEDEFEFEYGSRLGGISRNGRVVTFDAYLVEPKGTSGEPESSAFARRW